MCRVAFILAACLQASLLGRTSAAKQQVQLSESYLPVAMQVIAHLTDQMAFEAKDEPTTKRPPAANDWPKPTTKPPSWPKPTQKPTKPSNDWQKPTSKPPTSWPKPTSKPSTKPPYSWPPYTTKPSTPTNSWSSWTTSRPYVTLSDQSFKPPAFGFSPPPGLKPPGAWGIKPPSFPALGAKPPPSGGWWMHYGLLVRDATTPFHGPGFYAPVPPTPNERFRTLPKGEFLLPVDQHQYTVIQPQETRSDALLDVRREDEEVQPLIEPAQDTKLLPPHFQDEESDPLPRASDDLDQELTEENLQYLSQSVREMIRMANDPDDERLVDVWEGMRGANNQEITPKGKLSASNLRLLLLYDLLSREAKRLRLSDYSGFSPEVMRSLAESSGGGARAQLSFALSRMVERKDCQHEYANNRAKEMVLELARDESKLSSEIRYLQPLVYKL